MATNDVQMPKVGGLLETVDLQGRVINALARYVNEQAAFYDQRFRSLEQHIFGNQPAPTFPTFEDWMQSTNGISNQGHADFRVKPDPRSDPMAQAQDKGWLGLGAQLPNFRG